MRDGTGTEQLAETDEQLVERTRGGDRRAFAELWSRHYRSGITVARSFTNLDADDLVSEAFTRIYQRTLDGGGPRGAFRPYLYTTIRNLACTWGTARAKSVNVDDVADFEPTESAEEPAARSLDRTLTVQAYRSLPSRWQTVLWYTEVEGLDPSDVAPILGMSANGVAALSYRAREGLRKAWLQAHVTDATASGDCAWVLDRVGERARKSLTTRESRKLEAHLAICPKCSIVSQEVDDVGSRLAMAMIPLVLGGIAGGGILAASLGSGTAAVAASAVGGAAGGTAVAASAAPAAFGGATVTAAASGTAAATTGVLAVAASTVFVAAVSVGAVGIVQSNETAEAATASTSQAGALADPLGLDADEAASDTDSAGSTTVDPAAIPDEVEPTPASTPVVPVPEPTTDVTTDTNTDTTDTDTTSVAPSTDTKSSTTSSTTDGTGKKVTDTVTDTKTVVPTAAPTSKSVTGAVSDVVTGTTGTVDQDVTGTTGTVDSVVTGTTDAVDDVVDTVLPPGDGLVGSLDGTVDSVTGTVNGLTGTVTGTVNGTVGGVTGLVGGLLGGALKP